MGLPHLVMLAAGHRWLSLAAENRQPQTQEGPELTSPACNISGELDCSTSSISGGSEAATLVVRSLWSVLIDRRVLTADVDAGLGLTT